jgi:CO dehydrogenase maturation factor
MKSYDFVVIDNEAGMEHISRRTTRVADILIVVSDLSAIGVRSAGRIYELAKDIGMKFKCAFLVVNRADGDAKALSHEIARVGIPLAGEIPYSESLYKGGLKGESIFKLADKAIDDSVEKIFKETGIWSCCATNTPPR